MDTGPDLGQLKKAFHLLWGELPEVSHLFTLQIAQCDVVPQCAVGKSGEQAKVLNGIDLFQRDASFSTFMIA